jgi:phosphogluconate dehydratase
MGQGLAHYAKEPWLADGKLAWRDGVSESQDKQVLATVESPFLADGGLRLLQGNLGRSVIKVSAVQPQHRAVEAPAIVFDSQDALIAAFKRGELEKDFVAVVRFQGPRANGMPELHKLTPSLGVLQDRGFKVALVTDGRMSGASGKVPAAIHVTPEVLAGGPLGRVRTGDVIRLDADAGLLEAKVDAAEWQSRDVATADLSANEHGYGRELFTGFRHLATGAEEGAMSFMLPA